MISVPKISPDRPLGRLLRAPFNLIPATAVAPILQGPARGLRWVIRSSDYSCWLGSYESGKQQLFARFVRPGMTVLDVGANAGFYTLLAGKLAGAQGQVIAVEPFPENQRSLKRHMALNPDLNIRLIEAAASASCGEARFHTGVTRLTGGLSVDGDLVVTTITLDSLPRADLLKIDVEGAELEVLQGAERLLREKRPTIFLATHGAAVHAACCGLLREHGYQLAALDGTSAVENTDEVLATPQVAGAMAG